MMRSRVLPMAALAALSACATGDQRDYQVATADPAAAGDVTGSGGWLYNDTTGGIWIDHADHFGE